MSGLLVRAGTYATACTALSDQMIGRISQFGEVISGEMHPASGCGEVNLKGIWDARPFLSHVMVT